MDLQRRLIELGIESVAGVHWLVMTKDELEELERELRVRLPESYRWFLVTYGAAGFEKLMVFHSVRPLPEEISSDGDGPFSYFYGPENDTYETYSLRRIMSIMEDRMPQNLIPIGGTTAGDKICLGIRGAEAGKIYYWDHEREENEDDYLAAGLPVPPNVRFRNVHLIADSFEDFIHRLYIDEEA